MRSMRRVVIVGAGHNGLVAAVRLAAAGREVVVAEHGPRPRRRRHVRAGHAAGLRARPLRRVLPLTAASPAFEGLGVRERLDWVQPPVAMAHPFLDGTAIALHRDVAATAESLERVAAAGSGSAWEALVRPLVRRRDTVLRAALSPFPPPAPWAALALQLRRDGTELARRMLGSAASFGRDVFGDERAAA